MPTAKTCSFYVVNNNVVEQIINDWRTIGANVTTFQFPVEQGNPHDMVDVCTDAAKRALVLEEIFRQLGET